MSYEIYVYAATEDEPTVEEVSELLDTAGWQWVPVTDLDSFQRATEIAGSIALGWDLADDIGDSVTEVLRHDNPDLLMADIALLSVVAVEVETPFNPDPEIVSALRESDVDPRLVTRVEEAVACYAFRSDEHVTEATVEFMWALASAVGVLTDGVLEDVEEGTLIECMDDTD